MCSAELLAILLTVAYALLLLYYRWAWKKLPEQKSEVNYKPRTRVTVVIPVRNEEENIGNILTDIEAQQYPKELLEIVVVDDDSEDKTAEKIFEHQDVKYFFLQDHFDLGETVAYKKRSIELGIHKSKGELIITTDADCRMCEHWLISMVQAFEQQEKQMLAGPVIYHKTRSVLGIFQELDFMSMQGITGAVLQSQKGAMCNGANLAYTVEAFDQAEGFIDIDHVASGDDMMLMHKVQKAFPGQTAYVKNKEAIVFTDAAPNFKAFMNQRIRWASKISSLSDVRIMFVLGFVFVLNFMLFCLLIKGIYSPHCLQTALILFVVKTAFEAFFLWPVAGFFNRRKLLWFLLPLQPFHIIYMFGVGILGQLKWYHWKGRKVH